MTSLENPKRRTSWFWSWFGKVVLFGDQFISTLRGDTGVKICEILIFYHFCVFGIIIKIKLFTSM